MMSRVQSQVETSFVSPFMLNESRLLQRKCSCGGPAGVVGECEGCQKEKLIGKALQRKLTVNEPGDIYEQEADRVADAVIRISDSDVQQYSKHGYGPTGRKSDLMVNRYSQDDRENHETPSIVNDVLRSGGQPLDAATLSFMESRFGHNFSQVRVHTDAKAAESARSVDAIAYTVKTDIAFDSGQYAPTSTKGRALLAHELAHVIQYYNSVNSHTPVTNSLSTHHESKDGSATRSIMCRHDNAMLNRQINSKHAGSLGNRLLRQSPAVILKSSEECIVPRRGTIPIPCYQCINTATGRIVRFIVKANPCTALAGSGIESCWSVLNTEGIIISVVYQDKNRKGVLVTDIQAGNETPYPDVRTALQFACSMKP